MTWIFTKNIWEKIWSLDDQMAKQRTLTHMHYLFSLQKYFVLANYRKIHCNLCLCIQQGTVNVCLVTELVINWPVALIIS